MYTLTAADFADTGQWRLLLKIGSTGLEAFLENMLHPEIEPQPMCNVSWELNKDNLCHNIEEAVYSNPRLLDDFATRVILYDARTLFIPTEIAEEYSGAEEDLYRKVYAAEAQDIMNDREGGITAVWSPAPGVKSFLMRTFPGALITCNLMELLRKVKKGDNLRLYSIARKNEVDLLLLKDSDLISASTHEWAHPDDIAYLVWNLLQVYNCDVKEAEIFLQDVNDNTEAWNYIRGNVKCLKEITLK